MAKPLIYAAIVAAFVAQTANVPATLDMAQTPTVTAAR